MFKKPSSLQLAVAAVSMAVANIATAAVPNCIDVADKTSNQECQCVPVVNGKNLVKAGKTDCNTKDAKHSCAGQNSANEAGSWLLLPAGLCNQILAGNFQEIPAKTKTRLCERIDCPQK